MLRYCKTFIKKKNLRVYLSRVNEWSWLNLGGRGLNADSGVLSFKLSRRLTRESRGDPEVSILPNVGPPEIGYIKK